ncbi:hypothetical protein H257_07102 [Aphanomyces astaci]|uniref:FHA domain-containing protein n=1 Tax=Aphanomyces astaci TaxID=112090 RepID=W4GKK4_APHAT|nr:hypothetical protein H257_07102 [Aphanomyces astaci]ETV79891.1 hypothetical protein H257_07102 [Aphanomyces astaci]|eukprot:XP_009830827.1 hypothetical protein H257_07102 [Aphanomyces astaci]
MDSPRTKHAVREVVRNKRFVVGVEAVRTASAAARLKLTDIMAELIEAKSQCSREIYHKIFFHTTKSVARMMQGLPSPPPPSTRTTLPPSLNIQTSHLRFLQDPKVDQHHGTLEHTLAHGVWIYVDHSTSGTVLNHTHRLHHDAAIVRDGDHFLVGRTSFVVHWHAPSVSTKREPAMHMPSTPPPRRLVRKASVPMLVPAYTNSPIPKHKQQQQPPQPHDTPPSTRAGALPFDVAPPSPLPQSQSSLSRGPRPTPLTPPPKRDNLRIQISKKMANRIIHMALPFPPEVVMSPVPQAELRHRQQQLQMQLDQKATEDAWLHEQQQAFRLQSAAPSSGQAARRQSFTLDLVDRRPNDMPQKLHQQRHRDDDDEWDQDVDVTSSVSSSVQTQIARFRDSMEICSSCSSDGADDGDRAEMPTTPPPPSSLFRSRDVAAHLRQSFDIQRLNTATPPTRRPNPPPEDDDSRGVRLKRAHLVKTAPMARSSFHMTTALHSPYKTAKHASTFIESVASPTHFDYTSL